MAPAAKKPKGPGAYMVFSEEHRADVQAKLRAESADGKVPITVIAKALGELWKSLTEEQQQEYREKAQERAAEAAAAAEAAEDEPAAAGDDAEATAANPAAAALPRHLVKKIMLTDDDVQRVAADAVWLAAEAAALFLQQLAVKAAAAAAAKKRKTIQLQDFEHVVRCDKRLVEAGLKDVIQDKRFFEAHGVVKANTAAASKAKQQQGKLRPASAGNNKAQLGTDNDKENQQQTADGGQGADQGPSEAAEQAAEDATEPLTDEQRIELEEQRRQKMEAAATARAAKAAEKKVAKEREAAKGFHKISTFFPSNKPDAFV